MLRTVNPVHADQQASNPNQRTEVLQEPKRLDAKMSNTVEELPVAGMNTGSTNGHTHSLMRTGRTSVNHGHSHTWKKGAKRTGSADKHTHSLPGATKTKPKVKNKSAKR